MTRILQAAVVLSMALLFVPDARAKVVSQGASGFMIAHEAEVAVDPKAAYDAFVEVGRWWNDSHSFSGAAKNLSIEPKAGGCWCEALPNGGSVRHMTVVHANPGAMLVFNGGLGPLQFMGVAGSMQVSFKAKGSGTQVSVCICGRRIRSRQLQGDCESRRRGPRRTDQALRSFCRNREARDSTCFRFSRDSARECHPDEIAHRISLV